MIQFISALLAGAFLLTGCVNRSANTYDVSSATHETCVDSYDKEAREIAIYFDTSVQSVPKVQRIFDVSPSSIDESIANLGLCSEVITKDGQSY